MPKRLTMKIASQSCRCLAVQGVRGRFKSNGNPPELPQVLAQGGRRPRGTEETQRGGGILPGGPGPRSFHGELPQAQDRRVSDDGSRNEVELDRGVRALLALVESLRYQEQESRMSSCGSAISGSNVASCVFFAVITLKLSASGRLVRTLGVVGTPCCSCVHFFHLSL